MRCRLYRLPLRVADLFPFAVSHSLIQSRPAPDYFFPLPYELNPSLMFKSRRKREGEPSKEPQSFNRRYLETATAELRSSCHGNTAEQSTRTDHVRTKTDINTIFLEILFVSASKKLTEPATTVALNFLQRQVASHYGGEALEIDLLLDYRKRLSRVAILIDGDEIEVSEKGVHNIYVCLSLGSIRAFRCLDVLLAS